MNARHEVWLGRTIQTYDGRFYSLWMPKGLTAQEWLPVFPDGLVDIDIRPPAWRWYRTIINTQKEEPRVRIQGS